MKFPCARCGKDVAHGSWAMWRGRLVRVGPECVKRIAEEKAVAAHLRGPIIQAHADTNGIPPSL
jgi:hypothetical protein